MMDFSPLIVDSCEYLPARLDFRLGVAHSLASRSHSVNIYCIVRTTDGITGFGESVPRSYVTGETPYSAMAALVSFRERIKGMSFSSPRELIDYLICLGGEETIDSCPAAFTAFETALIDCAGNHWSLPAHAILGIASVHETLHYSLVAPLMPLPALRRFLESAASNGFRHVKVKVDDGDPIARVELARNVFGKDTGIRVDANCSWTRDNAPAFMEALAARDVEGVEQPLASVDLEGMARLRGNGLPPIVLDESVSSSSDLERAVAASACDIVNIRISKCGGFLRSLRLIEQARTLGIGVQIGAQVGESCILSAAGACLAASVSALVWLEGCFGRHLLVDDLCEADIRFGAGGRFTPLSGHGFGVEVSRDLLRKAVDSYRSGSPE